MSKPTENTTSIQLSALQTDNSQNCEVNSCSFNPLSFELICYASKANWSNRFQIMNSLSYFIEFSFLKFILIIYVLLGKCPFFSNLALYWHKIGNTWLITIVFIFAASMCFFSFSCFYAFSYFFSLKLPDDQIFAFLIFSTVSYSLYYQLLFSCASVFMSFTFFGFILIFIFSHLKLDTLLIKFLPFLSL